MSRLFFIFYKKETAHFDFFYDSLDYILKNFFRAPLLNAKKPITSIKKCQLEKNKRA